MVHEQPSLHVHLETLALQSIKSSISIIRKSIFIIIHKEQSVLSISINYIY